MYSNSEIGASLDWTGRLYSARTPQASPETRPNGMPSGRRNPETGNAGAITPTRTCGSATGEYCREYREDITVRGRTAQAQGSACHIPDGLWRVEN